MEQRGNSELGDILESGEILFGSVAGSTVFYAPVVA